MMLVRISPDAPTSDPAMMSTLLFSTNPVAAAASPEYEFRSAITTGMSAPPIGTTSMTPRTEATAQSAQYALGLPGSLMSHALQPSAASPSTTLSACCAPPTPLQWNFSASLPNATRLPQNVTVPISPDAAVATSGCISIRPPVCMKSAPATSVDAMPPNPLKIATISGMPVIGTRAAAIAPITLPTTTPARMNGNDSPSAISVAITASSIPAAPSALPRTAVRGWVSPLMPKMNRTEATR
jgi:hypothetical protein